MSSRTTGTAPQIELSQVEVNELDTRQYHAFTLPNCMHVLLISDPLCEAAVVAMGVGVGSFSDPDDLPGLTHFLEHMLTQGSARFPKQGDYNSFLAENSGCHTAFTDNETTDYTFYFGVEPDLVEGEEMPGFKKALHMFSQFFIAPLFEESAVEREVNAIQSECEMHKQNDTWRSLFIINELSNPAHPASKTFVGSKETLWDGPRANGVDTRARMVEFFNKFYSANLMNLCIIWPYKLDLLQNWVVELFSDVKNHNAPNPCDAYKHIPLLLPEQQGLVIYQETIQDVKKLKINWVTPSIVKDYRSKPMTLIRRLLEDKTKGSLHSLLKSKGWGEDVSSEHKGERDYGVLSLFVHLTEKGIDRIEDVISIVYDYLRLVQSTGIPKWMYEEEKSIRATLFRFRERNSAVDCDDCEEEDEMEEDGYACPLAYGMQYHSPEEFISGSWLLKEYAPDRVTGILDCLTPEKSMVVIQTKFHSAKIDRKERWFGTPYHVSRIPESNLKKWRDPEVNDSLHFPNRIQVIPTDFTILGEPLPPGEEDNEGPRCILHDKHMDLHYKLDRTFRTPKVSMFLEMETPLASLSLRHRVMFEMFTEMLVDSLTECFFSANRVGFKCSLKASGSGLCLTIDGYSHLIDVLLLEVVNRLAAFEPDICLFERTLEATIVRAQGYLSSEGMFAKEGNFATEGRFATAIAEINVNSILFEPYWTASDRQACLEDGSVNLEAMEKFSRDVLKHFHVTALVCGNITQQSVSIMMQSLREKLAYHPVPDAEQHKARTVQIPLSKDVFFRQPLPNLDDNNSAIEVYYQFGPLWDFKVELLADILDAPTFQELRTVQQLGYAVSEGVKYAGSVVGLRFGIQSTVASPDELLHRIDQFLIDVRKDVLVPMSDEQFANYVTGVSGIYSAPDEGISNQAASFWGTLRKGSTEYDRERKRAIALLSVTKDEIVKLFDDYIARDGPKRRRVVSQVFGGLHRFADREPLGDDVVAVLDPVAFRRQNDLYPIGGLQ